MSRIYAVQQMYRECVALWQSISITPWSDNIFVSASDINLLNNKLKEIDNLLRETDVKINNLKMLL